MPKIYGVYLGDEMVFSGSATEIVHEYDLYDRMTVYNYANKEWLLHRKYKVKYIGFRSKNKKKQEETKYEPSEHEKRLDYLYRHLKYKDSVYSNDNGEDYRDELKEMGIEFKAVPCVTFKTGYILWRA